MNFLLYLSLCLSALFVSVLSLSCAPCEPELCGAPPKCRKGVGLVKGICGCCDVCAKTEGQSCGGPWGIVGFCDKGLTCVVRMLNGQVVPQRDFIVGKCEPEKCLQKKCQIRQRCTVINQKPVCECPRHCKRSGKVVCGLKNGVEYDNECQLRKFECKYGKRIGLKEGPCRRCFLGRKTYKFGEQIKKGQCESCICFHGSWNCTNVCPQPEPLVAPEGAECDISGKTILCGPGMDCQPNPNRSKGHGICTAKRNHTLIVPIPEILLPPPPMPCPTRQCNRCKYGYIVDENGCETCECRSKKSDCSLPKQPGPCLGYIPRYYFNPKIGKCMKFIYGGCQPNANNFKTRKACEKKCLV